MPAVIKSIDRASPAARSHLSVGDEILSVNGNKILDVLDYKYYTYEKTLRVAAKTADGKFKLVQIKKREGEDLGLEFDDYLMDKLRRCANRCVFCFIDQLPEGMRETLYFKDDDSRMSFLMGNYVTLTNLSEHEVQRIIDLKISPINVSVHTTNPELRALMLGNRNGGKGIETMRRFADAGIVMNCQIVLCPGLNDGEELSRSLRDLESLYPQVKSVSVVPVGLTRYREGLYPLTPVTEEKAKEILDTVEAFAENCRKKHGSRIFFCADEFYLKANRPLPADEYFEDYIQLENGIGMLRLLITEFESALRYADECAKEPFFIATGVSAAPFMEMLIKKAKEKFPQINGFVIPIRNEFFGESVDVAGLVTGGDIIKQCREKNHPKKMLIPQSMLKAGEGVFLDDITIQEIEKELGVTVIPVPQDGGSLLDAMLGNEVETWQNR